MDKVSFLLNNTINMGKFEEELSDAMSYVSLASTMISYAMYRATFHFCDSPEVLPTAAATITGKGNHVFFDKTFWEKNSPKQRAYVLYHEVLHVFLEHPLRGAEMMYDRKIWGKAVDYMVNSVCEGAFLSKGSEQVKFEPKLVKYLEAPTVIPPLFDERFVGLTADEIYNILKEEEQNEEQTPCDTHQTQGDDDQDKSLFPSDGTLDAHPQTEDIGGNEEDLTDQINKNRQTLIAGAKIAESTNSIGSHEGDIVDQITEIVKPVVSWDDKLRFSMGAKIPVRSTYNKISTKSSGSIIFPTYTGDHLNVFVGVDSSGSMGENDFIRAFSEIVGLLEELDSFYLEIVSCDVRVHPMGQYDSDTYFDHTDIKFTPTGRGGTVLSPIEEYMEERIDDGDEFDVMIVISDGMIMSNDLHYESNYDVPKIFISTRKQNVSLRDFEVIYTN